MPATNGKQDRPLRGPLMPATNGKQDRPLRVLLMPAISGKQHKMTGEGNLQPAA